MNELKKLVPILLLSAYSLFLVVLLLKKTYFTPQQVPTWDDAHHLKMGFLYYSSFISHSFTDFWKIFSMSHQIYPPLYHILIAVSFIFFGANINSAIYLNTSIIPVLVFSTYGLGKVVFNKKVGIISALTVPILPLFLSLQESVFIDYLSITLFILSFYIMFKADYFKRINYSIALGFVIFLEMITKWSFVIPSIPILFYWFYSLITQKKDKLKILLNSLLIITIVSLGLVWYSYNFPYVIDGLYFFWNPNGFAQKIWDFPERYSLDNLLWYVSSSIYSTGIGIVPLIVFIISIFIKNVKGNKNIIYLMFSVVITFTTLTYLNDKSEKYIGYVYPIVIIYTLGKIESLKTLFVKKIIFGLLVFFVSLNYFLSYIDFSKNRNYFVRSIPLLPGYSKWTDNGIWPTEKMSLEINKRGCQSYLLVLSDSKYLNPSSIKYYNYINNIDINVISGHFFYDPSDSNFDNLEITKKFNCIISKSGDIGVFANRTVVSNLETYIKNILKYNTVDFEAPDGSVFTLYYEQN